ncbi:Stf0 family sulfotransferase [Halomonas elongata]|uniref:Stf0 family sulfotransferase n=1 Tax=Halomonas elongata TaxID=2746 RepID=UPI0023AE9F7A|nr:Stf0 family sulfotransferase [Halomonas elongata]
MRYEHFEKIWGGSWNDGVKIQNAVVVLFSNRTGSNLLVQYLKGSLNLSGGMEVFNPGPMIKAKNEGVKSFKDYVATLCHERSVIKVSLVQLKELVSNGVSFEGCEFLLTYRKDVLRQAISFEIAKRTKQWVSNVEGRASVSGDDFDYDSVNLTVKNLSRTLSEQFSFMSSVGFCFLPIMYEDLNHEPVSVMNKVFDFLGVQPLIRTEDVNVKLQKQSGSVNSEWVDKYREEFFRRISVC